MAANQLVHSFVVSRVDYCNSILSGAPAVLTDRIQSVLNAAARLIYERGRFDYVTDILRDRLHWLRVPSGLRLRVRSCLQSTAWSRATVHRQIMCALVVSWNSLRPTFCDTEPHVCAENKDETW